MRFLVALSCLAVACLAAPQKEVFEWEAPAFCNGLDCPPFKVLEKTADYEKREYKESTWVATKMEAPTYEEASRILFNKLFAYLNKENEADMQIDMTAPVLVTVTPGPGPNCPSEFEMHFYISSSIANPPKPSADDVYLKTIKQATVYTRYYPGFSFSEDIIEQTFKLGQALQTAGKKFVGMPYYYAGYDSPFKLFNRHNEVVLVAQD